MSDPALVQQFFKSLSSMLPADVASKVIAIANLSPSLLNDITYFESQKGILQFLPGNTAGFNLNKTITLPQSSSSYWLNPGTNLVTFASQNGAIVPVSSTQVSSTGLSLAGQIVGALAHELGHFKDTMQISELAQLNMSTGIDQAFYVGIRILSEGKATVNAIRVARDVAANGGTPDQLTNVSLVTGANQDSNLGFAVTNPDPNAADAAANYASHISG